MAGRGEPTTPSTANIVVVAIPWRLDAVDTADVDRPAGALVLERDRGRPRQDGTTEELLVEGFTLDEHHRVLVEYPVADGVGRRRDELAVRHRVAGIVVRARSRADENAPRCRRCRADLLRQLHRFARHQRDVAGMGGRRPLLAGRRRGRGRGGLGGGANPGQVALERPAARFGRSETSAYVVRRQDGVTAAAARVAAVEDDHDVRALRRDVLDQLVELLVGEVAGPLGAAVGADDRLVLAGRLEEPEPLLDGLVDPWPLNANRATSPGPAWPRWRSKPSMTAWRVACLIEQHLEAAASASRDAAAEQRVQRVDVGHAARAAASACRRSR